MARYSQPTLKVNNEFYEDPLLYSWLRHNLPKEVTQANFDNLTKSYQFKTIVFCRFSQRFFAISSNWAPGSPLTVLWFMESRMRARETTLERVAADGRRVDTVLMSPGWSRLRHFSAREGIVGTAYERKYGPWRYHLLFHNEFLITIVPTCVYRYTRNCTILKPRLPALQTLPVSPSGGLYPCPLAMTDGAAKVLEPFVRIPPTHHPETSTRQKGKGEE